MTDQPETLRHTVSFSRKKNLGNYESVDAGLFLQFEMPADAQLGDIIEEADRIWHVQMAAVYDRLGLPYEINADTGAVSEDSTAAAWAMLEEAFVPGPPAPEVRSGPTGEGVGSAPPFDPNTTDNEQKRLNKQWAVARLGSNPGDFYDNREKKASGQYKPNAADYTHKETRMGVWL